MTYVVVLAPGAEVDLFRLEGFLLDRNPAAAVKAGLAIGDAITSLATYPERGSPGVRRDVRRLFVPFGKGAYVLEYRVDPGKVVVARIFHSLEDRSAT